MLVGGVAVGAVTAQEATEISDAQELQDIQDDLAGDYVLVDDIDLSTVDSFEPIGDFNQPFMGSFDGGGYTVEGLDIERVEESDVGLFGAVGSSGVVENVGVEDAFVDGEQWVGILVGYNEGTVSDTYAAGEAFADTRVGGLVGGNDGTVERSYAESEVSGVDIVGGLVGRNEGDISESYADASVAGFDLEDTEAQDLGGLVGVNLGQVSDSYATGEVLGDEFVGGLVGASDGEITRSYATAEVVGDEATGGLVGELDFDDGIIEASLTDSYWDLEATAQSDAVGAEGDNSEVENVEGLDSVDMQGDAAENSMSALDFDYVWRTVTEPDGYPVLVWQVEEVSDEGFTVEITGTNEPVVEGETLNVQADVTNTGETETTQQVVLEVDDTTVGSDEITVSGETTESVTLTWTTEIGDAGVRDVTVRTDDDSDTVGVTVESEGEPGFDMDDYRNDEGRVDTAGLQAAISDFLAGDIDTGDLQDVIREFLAGT